MNKYFFVLVLAMFFCKAQAEDSLVLSALDPYAEMKLKINDKAFYYSDEKNRHLETLYRDSILCYASAELAVDIAACATIDNIGTILSFYAGNDLPELTRYFNPQKYLNRMVHALKKNYTDEQIPYIVSLIDGLIELQVHCRGYFKLV